MPDQVPTVPDDLGPLGPKWNAEYRARNPSELPHPDSPFPLHPFDAEPPGPRRTACRAWRLVVSGERQLCPYARHDPVHMESARTPVDPGTGEVSPPLCPGAEPGVDSGELEEPIESADLAPPEARAALRRYDEEIARLRAAGVEELALRTWHEQRARLLQTYPSLSEPRCCDPGPYCDDLPGCEADEPIGLGYAGPRVEVPPTGPLDREAFIEALRTTLEEFLLPERGAVTVSRIDSRTLGVKVGTQRFILDVEAVDERPDSPWPARKPARREELGYEGPKS